MKALLIAVNLTALGVASIASTTAHAGKYITGTLAYDDAKQGIVLTDIQGIRRHDYNITFKNARFITEADTCLVHETGRVEAVRKPCRAFYKVVNLILAWPVTVQFRCEITKVIDGTNFEVSTCRGQTRKPDGTLIRDWYFPEPYISGGIAFALTEDGKIDLNNQYVNIARQKANGVWAGAPEFATPTTDDKPTESANKK